MIFGNQKNFTLNPSFEGNTGSEVNPELVLLNIVFPNSSLSSLLDGKLIYVRYSYMIPGSTIFKSFVPNSLLDVSTKFDSIHFITCAPIKHQSYLSLLGYISAFDCTTWILVFFLLVLSCLLWNYICLKSQKSPIEIAFFVYILLGQST